MFYATNAMTNADIKNKITIKEKTEEKIKILKFAHKEQWCHYLIEIPCKKAAHENK